MEISSTHQMYVFLLCILCGMLCGLFFDFQRSIRRLCFAGFVRTTLEDILFVVICTVALIELGLCFNNGQIRYYQIMGGMSGALFYAAFLTRYVMRILNGFYAFILKIILKPIVKIFMLICVPIKKIFYWLKKLRKKLSSFLKRFFKHREKKKRRLKKRIKML